MLEMVNGYLIPKPELAASQAEMLKSAGLGAQFNVPGLAPDAQELLKTLNAGNYQTDVAQLQGGEAVRVESLDRVLKNITIEMDDFKLWKDLRTNGAGAIVDQWIEKGQDSIARHPGSGFNSEAGVIQEHNANYKRRTAEVKYLMVMRNITVVLQSQRNVIDVESDENTNATLEILQSLEWANFFGAAGIVPEEFDGLEAILEADAPDNIVDLEGRSDVEELYQNINKLQAKVKRHGNFGLLTDSYHGTFVQSDLDQFLTPGHRVSITGAGNDITLGAPVRGIQTSWGAINMKPDIFTGLRADQKPMAAVGAIHPTDAPPPPAAFVAAASAPDVASKFQAGQNGEYYWKVASVNKNGESTLVDADTSRTLAVGDSVLLTITEAGASSAETGYAIYRGRRNVNPASADDVRFVRRVPRTGASTTFTDQNLYIPGTETVFLVNNKKALDAISFQILSNLTRFKLYPTNTLTNPFAYFLFGYLRVTKALQHAIVRNYLSIDAEWKPFS